MQKGSLSLVRNDDQDLGITVLNPDQSAYNLSGCALIFTARTPAYFSDPLINKTVTNHLDPVAGLSQFSFVPADTAGLSDKPYFFDIRLISAASKATTLIYGDLTILPL